MALFRHRLARIFSQQHSRSFCWGRGAACFYRVAARAQFSSSSVGGGGEPQQSTTHAFDRTLKEQQRNSAARAHTKWKRLANDKSVGNNRKRPYPPQLVSYDYIRQEIATRLVDRLDDCKTDEGFPLALDLGAGAGYVYRAICAEPALQGEGGIGGVRKLVQLDSSEAMLHRDANVPVKGGERCESYRLNTDEEGSLPFPDGTFDLVISSASLHWVNQLPQTLHEIRRVLKPNGCFLWAMIGGNTLPELRVAMVMAELERQGGVSPHVGPFVGLTDIGGLLQSAGFSLPTLDVDNFQVSLPNAATLMEHLQRMGESNASVQRHHRTSLDTFLAACCIYDDLYGAPLDQQEGHDTEIPASVSVIYAIGWIPHHSQQQPLERGSATHRIQDHIGKEEDSEGGKGGK